MNEIGYVEFSGHGWWAICNYYFPEHPGVQLCPFHGNFSTRREAEQALQAHAERTHPHRITVYRHDG